MDRGNWKTSWKKKQKKNQQWSRKKRSNGKEQQQPKKSNNQDNEEVWSKAYLPVTRTTEVRGSYEEKVVFKHVQIRLVASNEPLMGCGPLRDWLKDKRCIYALDTFDDNLCVWRCLVIYKRLARSEKYRVQERNCNAAKKSSA